MLSMISLLLYCLREVLIAFSDFSYTFMNDFCVNYYSVVSFFLLKIALIAKFNDFRHLFLAYVKKK